MSQQATYPKRMPIIHTDADTTVLAEPLNMLFRTCWVVRTTQGCPSMLDILHSLHERFSDLLKRAWEYLNLNNTLITG
jgi:hypothetical protein